MKLRSMGPEGERAFMQVATALGAAELPLKRTNALMDKLWITMKNTARWRLTTGVLNSFIGGLQQAFGYAKSLNASLNDIRIVSGKSADEMARFAKEANRAAQELSTTTTTYTDASLIYYQQGLNDDEVKKRTDATIKMANVTGQTAETISQQMTAVWNNFYDGTRSLESFEDAMVALGASTATSSKEIAEGLEKFAPVANTVGLSFDYAAAALATITATTRESASVAGNALKTLFSRLEGLKLGETLDDGTDLNKYSQALYSVGINIKDVSGELKDMDTILDELGARWQTLARDQQMALAETVGGVRQYAQLVALMDNWDFFQTNLTTARGSEGSLDKQAQIYAESWEAARDRVKAATEDIYDSLINPQIFIDLDNIARPILKTFASMLDAVGGLTGLLPILSALMFKVYSTQIANQLRDMAVNIGLMTGHEQERARAIQAQSAALVERLSLGDQDNTTESTRIEILKTQIGLQGDINAKAEQYNEAQLAQIKNATYIIELLRQQSLKQTDVVDKAQQALVEQQDTIRLNIIKPDFNDEGYGSVAGKFAEWFVNGFSERVQPLMAGALGELLTQSGDINKAFSYIDSGMESVLQRSAQIEILRNLLGDTNKESGEWKAQIQELAINMGLLEKSTSLSNAELDNLRSSVAQNGEAANETNNDLYHLQEILSKLGIDQSSIISYTARMRDLQRQKEALLITTEQYKQKVAELRAEIEKGIPATKDWADMFVMAGRAMSQAAMGMRAVESFSKALTDKTLDGEQRVTQLLTSTAMLLPVLTSGITAVGKAIAGTVTGMQAAIPIITAASVIIFAIVKAIQALITSQEEAQTAIDTSVNSYKEATSELENLNSELETTQQRIKELQQIANENKLSLTDKEELQNLQIRNAELERQKELQEKIAKIKQREAVNTIFQNGLTAYQFTAKPGSFESAGTSLEEAVTRVQRLEESHLRGFSTEFAKDIEYVKQTIGDPSKWGDAPTEEAMMAWLDGLKYDTEEISAEAAAQIVAFKENLEDYITGVYNWMPEEATEAALDKWLAENIDTYEKLETAYQTVAQSVIDGQTDANSLYFKLLKQRLQETRALFYEEEEEYGRTFLDSVINNLNAIDLQKIVENNFKELSQEGQNLLTLFGVEPEEIATRYSSAFEIAQNKLSKFGLQNIPLTYVEAKLIADDDFKDFRELLDHLEEISGVIPVSLQVDVAEDARTEALANLASGELLDDDAIKQLQEAYQGIADLSDFGSWAVNKQIDFLANEGNAVQAGFGSLSDQLQNLKATQKEIEEQINRKDKQYSQAPQYIKEDLLSAERAYNESLKRQIDITAQELTKLKAKFEKDPWQIQIEMGNQTAASINNLKKTIGLISEDLSVGAEDLVELGKRYPEALVDAYYDADQNILKISETTYQELQSLLDQNIEQSLEKRRDESAQELIQVAETAASSLAVIAAIEEAKRNEYKTTSDKEIDLSGKTLEEIKSATLFGMSAVVRAEIEKRQQALDTAVEQSSSSKAATETMGKNAQATTENYSEAAYQITKAFDEAFAAIALGTRQILSGTGAYQSILSSGIKKTINVNTGSAGIGTYEAEKQAVKESQEYQDATQAIKRLNTFATALDMYQKGEVTNWVTIQDIFNRLPEEVKSSFTEGFQSLIDNGITIKTGSDFLVEDETKSAIEDTYNKTLETVKNLLEDVTKQTTNKGTGSKSSGNLKEEEAKEFKEELERYHEITREIEYQERALKKLETQINRTYGLDRLKLYEKQIKELTKLAELQEQKAKEAAGYVGIDLANLTSLGLKPQQNKDTLNLDNYTQLLKDSQEEYKEALEEYNNWLATVWNAAETKEEQEALEATKEAQNDLLEKAKELYDDRIEALKKYEESVDTYLDQKEKVDEALRNIEDAKLNSISYRMEVILDVREARKQIRDFTKEIAQSFGDALTHGAEEARLGWEQAKDEMAMYKEYVQEYNDLKALLDNANEHTDTTAIIDELKNLEGNIIESGQRLLEWADYVENMFVEALSAASERFKRFTDQLAHDTNILGTIKELYTLQGITYKVEGGFAQLMQTAEGQYQGYLRQAQLNKEWYEDRAAQLAQAEAALQGVLETDIRYDTLKKNRDALLAEANEAQQAMLDNAKSAMEVAKQMYLDQIEKMAYELEKRITGGSGFNLLQDKYDHYLEENDRYLDNIEESLETSIWYTRLQQDIDKTGNNAYKERLKRLQEEIDLRREGNTLSKYDLDILEAKYKVLQAQAALEDAQNNKSKVRLVRDSNGNWNYQFTADQSDIGTQEEELLKAKQNEYEITKQRYKDLNDEMIRMAEEFAEKDRQIREDMANGILTEEEGQARLAELKRYYEEKANYLSIELNIAKRDMTEAAITSATLSAGLTESVYNSSNELIQTIVNTFKNTHSPQLLSAASTTLSELQIALGAHISEFADASDEIKASIAKIIGTETSDGQDINGLVQRLNTSIPEIAAKLAGWKDVFSDAIDPITIALQSIIEGGDIEGISANQLPQYLQDIAEGSLYDVLMGDGDNSYSGLAHGVANNFTEQFDSIIGVIEENFIPAIEEHMPEAAKAFEDFTQKIEDTANAIGVGPNNLSDMTNELTNDIQRMYDEGYEAINVLEQQLWATYDLQAGYLELAQSVWEYIYALQALAANQVVPTIEAASGIDAFGDTSSEKEKLPYTGDLSQKMAAALYNEDLGSYTTFQNQRQVAEDQFGTDIVGSTDEIDRKLKNMTDDQLERIATGVEYIDTTLTKEHAQDVYDFTGSPTIHIASGATGMYTGEFDGGKLGILHEKELLLNAEDTQNILSAVSAVRGISDVLFGNIADRLDSDGLAAMAMLGSRIGGISLPGPADSSLEQHVIIESVSFPGVTSSREIEEAFENLVNDAAQWARRRKS